MTFALRQLSVLAYAQGFTLWHYRADPTATPNPLDAALHDGFFNPAADMIASGDIVLLSSPQGARILTMLNDAGHVRALPMA